MGFPVARPCTNLTFAHRRLETIPDADSLFGIRIFASQYLHRSTQPAGKPHRTPQSESSELDQSQPRRPRAPSPPVQATLTSLPGPPSPLQRR